ncbi:MAG: RluA family pseudouridine synthase [Bacteroidetes bacterium]|nr:RluA family pseudouridine synthase [Bacteroidota bacterium]
MKIEDHIIFEDETILVINKPNGLMVEPDRNNHVNLLDIAKKYVFNNFNSTYIQHLHRLDRPTSGLILFTKKREYLHELSNQFAERKVKKFYTAISENFPLQSKDTLMHWHRKEKKKAKIYDTEFEYTEQAILTYSTEKVNNKCLWQINLQTGKYHQIRAQLQYINCSIIGDVDYGSKINFENSFIALHAKELSFAHPLSKQLITIQAPTPSQFNNLLI